MAILRDIPETRAEELANSLTHGFGAVLSLLGGIVLLVLAYQEGDFWHILSCAIFGVSLLVLYTASTLYHSFKSPRWKKILRRVDHMAIFLLIAGTYTPFALVLLRDSIGWTLFGLIWGLAVIGIAMKIFFFRKYRILSVLFYLFMGWLAVFALDEMWAAMGTQGMYWIFAGGLSYTLGLVFYGWGGLRFNHAIWHVFVLAGSVFHYLAVLFHVVGEPIG